MAKNKCLLFAGGIEQVVAFNLRYMHFMLNIEPLTAEWLTNSKLKSIIDLPVERKEKHES